ncbi:MAG: ATP-dependent DNA ligase, partial [Roseiarcus sp.]
MRGFAELYRRLESATSTRAKQAALIDAFTAARDDPSLWASAAWTVYFLSGGKPRQTVPTRILRRLAVEGSGFPEWLCEECYGSVGDLAETLSLLLPEGVTGEEVSLDVWMRELLQIPALDDEEKFARLRRWVGEL